MLSSFRFVLVALFATTVVALPAMVPTPTRRMTNSERFARGLPPNPPHRRSNHVLEARQSPVPGNFAAVPRCQPRPGLVEAVDAHDNSVLGYIRNTLTGNGTFGLTPNLDEALIVQANCDGTTFDLNTIGSTSSTPLLGAFSGLSSDSSDLKPGSSNCAQFSGVSHTDPGSVATFVENAFTIATNIWREVESAIWSLDDTTNILTTNWVNDDGSHPTTFCTYVPDVDIMYLTGDVAAFSAAVAPQQVHEVVLKLVPQ